MSLALSPMESIDRGRIAAIAARLDLRLPNQEAMESIVFAVAQHYDMDREPPPFEAVVDVATGVGKTYILATAIEYYAAQGVRNFAVVAPGRTILNKTVANFTLGHTKSLLFGMEVQPVVITSDNFATPAMRAAMDDPGQIKLFIFTVQALIKPQSKAGRKTHRFQEGLGEAFYAHLQSLDDLFVFADEHHTYYGPAFSGAIRDLRPWVLLGLTATPHKKTPPDSIIYRYPLAAAIADRLVKTPVLVGRKDDRADAYTKLLDGVRLLELKEQMMARWMLESEQAPVAPMMLVIAPTIADAEEVAQIVESESFASGRYIGKVLTVHSSAPDAALESLDGLEEPHTPYRVIISVGMLKEGWDVKNVYVIASLRASVSEILTEQTLGRGLRLPFGSYTGVELLDTLEVLGHERYEDLLKKANVLNEQFIDWRTRSVLRHNANGQLVSVPESTPVSAPIAFTDFVSPAPEAVGRPLLQSVEDTTRQAESQLAAMRVEMVPRQDLPLLRIPSLRMTVVRSPFSLADITDLGPFIRLGERLAADPSDSLRRVMLSAQKLEGPDGLPYAKIVPGRASDRVESPISLFPIEELRDQLVTALLNAPVVPARARECHPAAQIVAAFLKGLGPQAEVILSGYFDRVAGALVQAVTEVQRNVASRPEYGEVVSIFSFNKVRLGRPETSDDRYGPFKKGVGYTGFRKSLYPQDWFDSAPERAVANILDDEETIAFWVRLQVGDVPILWDGAGKEYNPDFVALDSDGVHWLIEVKSDRDLGSAEVQAKREAARRWANYVSADEGVGAVWRYLLASESYVAEAKGSWNALKGLGSQ